jgi:hypothetical protein
MDPVERRAKNRKHLKMSTEKRKPSAVKRKVMMVYGNGGEGESSVR